MDMISPCHPMFGCINRNDDKNLCEDICDHLAYYRMFLDKYARYTERRYHQDNELTLYFDLPSSSYDGAVDEYSSIIPTETFNHNYLILDRNIDKEI